MFFLVVLSLLVVFEVPGLFRKLRETPGRNSHQVSSKSEIRCTSYVQKTKYLVVLISFFLIFPDKLSKSDIFELKIGFLMKNCVFWQLEWSRIVKFCQNMKKFSTVFC